MKLRLFFFSKRQTSLLYLAEAMDISESVTCSNREKGIYLRSSEVVVSDKELLSEGIMSSVNTKRHVQYNCALIQFEFNEAIFNGVHAIVI